MNVFNQIFEVTLFLFYYFYFMLFYYYYFITSDKIYIKVVKELKFVRGTFFI